MKGHEFRPPFCEQDIQGWFALSYSSYLVLPRSLLQIMPAPWQHEFVELLEQARDKYPAEHSTYAVFKRGEDGRFTKDPLAKYRYPDLRAIADARGIES